MGFAVTVVSAAVIFCAPRLCFGQATEAGASSPDDDARQLRNLDFRFGTQGPIESLPGLDTAKRAARFRGFVRSRMGQDAFYANVLPSLFNILQDSVKTPMPFELKEGRALGRTYYYLSKPCRPKDRVHVHPWWDLPNSVWICRDSYHPEVKVDERAGAKQYCEATNNLNPEQPVCRCGKYLLNCAQNHGQNQQLSAAYRNEVIDTLKYVIQSHQPFSTILTMRETVRSDLADLYYARNHYFTTGEFLFHLSSEIGSKPKLRGREAMFEGGILTTPHIRYFDESVRLIMVRYFENFLCSPNVSTAVKARMLFHVETPNFRKGDHIGLASMIGCRDCHTRLEYGMRAFSGFISSRDGFRYVPAAQTFPKTKFFVRTWNDLRGEGPATPLWFGQMASKQPEFGQCLVHKAEEFIYAGYPVPADVDHSLQAEFRKKQDFAQLLENAVVARFVGLH